MNLSWLSNKLQSVEKVSQFLQEEKMVLMPLLNRAILK